MITEIILYFAIGASILTNIYLFAILYLQKKINKAENEFLEMEIEELKAHKKFLEDYFFKLEDKKNDKN